jgi:two-component system, NarL family, invasion response regulator UvrY
MTSPVVRVVIADDYPLLVRGVRRCIEELRDIEVVGEATTVEDLERYCRDSAPTLLIVDIGMLGHVLSTILQRVRAACPELKIIMITAYDDGVFVRQSLAAGVQGYVLKDTLVDELAVAMRAVIAGEVWYSPSVRSDWFDSAQRELGME